MKIYFQKISLSAINLYGVIILFLFAILFTFLVIFEEYRDFEQEEVLLRQTYLTAQKQHIQDEAKRVLDYIRHEHDRSKIQDQEMLKERIVSSIEHLFSKKNSSSYIFIYTLEGSNISDPNKPKNLNKKMSQLKNANGFDVLGALIEKAKTGGGYVEYFWDNPVTKKISKKISYVTGFEPYGWLVGTGVYLDEIENLMMERKRVLKERLIKYMMEILTLATILFGLAFAGMKLINGIVRNEIDTFRDFFKKAVEHYMVIDKKQIYFKEFHILVEYVNEMVSAVHQKNYELKKLNASLEKKVLEKTAKLQKQMEYNKQLVNMQDSFIKHSIHEINTPLAVIMTHIDIYKMKYGQNSYLSKIEAASKMIANIYDDLSYMVKKDRIVYEKHWINFSAFLHERIVFFEEIAVGNGHKIQEEIEEGIVIYFNEIELQRIIDNNLSNAVKYAKKSTEIEIRLYKEKDTAVLKCSTHSKKIEDTKQIFEAFHQEETKAGGFGLGLEIVGAICQKEDIRIEVDSDDKLTTFSYYFKKVSP